MSMSWRLKKLWMRFCLWRFVRHHASSCRWEKRYRDSFDILWKGLTEVEKVG